MNDLSQLALIWAETLVAVLLARATRLTPVVYYLGVGAEDSDLEDATKAGESE